MIPASNSSDHSNFQLLLLDLLPTQISFRQYSLSVNENVLGCLPANLPLLLPKGRTGIRAQSQAKQQALVSQSILKKIDQVTNEMIAEKTIIMLGVYQDPMSAFEIALPLSLQVIERLVRFNPRKFLIQSRSPLTVLLVPLLKFSANRILITIPIETANDRLGQFYTPQLPKISERLETVAALRTAEISVAIQVAPLLPLGHQKECLDDFAKALVNTGASIFIKPLSWFLQQSINTKRYTEAARKSSRFHATDPQTTAISNLLTQKIRELDPSKLVQPLESKTAVLRTGLIAA